MFLGDFESVTQRFNSIVRLLETDYGIDISTYMDMDDASLLSEIYKLQQKRSKIVLESSFGSYHTDENYNQTIYLLEALRMILREIHPKRSKNKTKDNGVGKMAETKNEVTNMNQLLEEMMLNEGELERAEIVLATRDVVGRLQKMIEDLGKMGTDDLMPLVDGIRVEFGVETAEMFSKVTEEKIQGAADSIQDMKDSMEAFAQQFEGRISDEDIGSVPQNDMSNTQSVQPLLGLGGVDDNVGVDADISTDDMAALGDLGADQVQADAEPLGRAKKESIEVDGTTLNETFKIITVGGKRIKITNEQFSVLLKAKLLTEKIKTLGSIVTIPSLATTNVNSTVITISGKTFRLNEKQIQSLMFAKNFMKLVENKKAKNVRLNEEQSQKLINARLLINKINHIVKNG